LAAEAESRPSFTAGWLAGRDWARSQDGGVAVSGEQVVPLRPLAPGQITTHWLDGEDGSPGCWSQHTGCVDRYVAGLRAQLASERAARARAEAALARIGAYYRLSAAAYALVYGEPTDDEPERIVRAALAADSGQAAETADADV
jgi:hypothetical protein